MSPATLIISIHGRAAQLLYFEAKPPSTVMIDPVIQSLCDEVMKRTASETSLADPSRGHGVASWRDLLRALP